MLMYVHISTDIPRKICCYIIVFLSIANEARILSYRKKNVATELWNVYTNGDCQFIRNFKNWLLGSNNLEKYTPIFKSRNAKKSKLAKKCLVYFCFLLLLPTFYFKVNFFHLIYCTIWQWYWEKVLTTL